MADLKRKQLKEFLSGSFGITGSLNVTGSVEFDKDISGSITSTGSFSRLVGDTISVSNTIFASGSEVQTIMDATGSYASASTTYLMESQTGSFATGSDVQGILDTYVRQSESSSYASGSDLQPILAESSSYVVERETGSFASGSDLQIILAESASYVMSTSTGSFLQNVDTASFSTLHVEGNITTSGSVTAQEFHTEVVSSSIIYESGSTTFGDTIDDVHNRTGSLFVSGNITFDTNLTGSITSTASFGQLETDGVITIGSNKKLYLNKGEDTYIQSMAGDIARVVAGGSQMLLLDYDTGNRAVFGNGTKVYIGSNNNYQPTSELVVEGAISGSGNLDVLSISGSNLTVISGSILSTGSFGRIVGDTISVSNTIFASGSDLQVILAESASYLVNTDTGSLGLVTLGSDITGSITSTASFGDLVVADNTFISNNLSVGTDVIGQKLQVDGDVGFTGQLDVTGSVSGGLSSTGSFGWVEILGTRVVDSSQTGSFASGSDFHQILTESSSYLVNSDTSSLGATTMNSTLFVQGDITTSGSITAREFKTEFVSSSIIYASGSNQFGDTGDDVHEFSGSVKVGNLTFSTSSIGIQSDTDLISLSDDTFTLNGSIVIDDGANIGIDSDTNLLDLNDQNLIVNGVLDATGRIDAQAGIQVSGSSLAVGNDLTLNYTSPVSHSLVYVNYTNKTVDLVPAASASGQLVQYNGSGWIITDEIDGGSF
tara:strand:+ start:678 stop:2828 length:2151 start_codon:yes stop_codon:yes gene_type:complete